MLTVEEIDWQLHIHPDILRRWTENERPRLRRCLSRQAVMQGESHSYQYQQRKGRKVMNAQVEQF